MRASISSSKSSFNSDNSLSGQNNVAMARQKLLHRSPSSAQITNRGKSTLAVRHTVFPVGLAVLTSAFVILFFLYSTYEIRRLDQGSIDNACLAASALVQSRVDSVSLFASSLSSVLARSPYQSGSQLRDLLATFVQPPPSVERVDWYNVITVSDKGNWETAFGATIQSADPAQTPTMNATDSVFPLTASSSALLDETGSDVSVCGSIAHGISSALNSQDTFIVVRSESEGLPGSENAGCERYSNGADTSLVHLYVPVYLPQGVSVDYSDTNPSTLPFPFSGAASSSDAVGVVQIEVSLSALLADVEDKLNQKLSSSHTSLDFSTFYTVESFKDGSTSTMEGAQFLSTSGKVLPSAQINLADRSMQLKCSADDTPITIAYLLLGLGLFVAVAGAYLTARRTWLGERAVEEKDRMSRMLSISSHEIFIPLSNMMGYVRSLHRLSENASPGEPLWTVRTEAQMLDCCVSHSLSVLHTFLEYSKIESGFPDSVNVQLTMKKLIQESVHIVYPAARQKGLRLAFDIQPGIPSMVIGDEVRIRQILLNYLHNAIKFTDDGMVLVNLRVADLDEQKRMLKLKIAVLDDGVGVTAADQRRLFERFSTVPVGPESEKGSRIGTGVGLEICRSLAYTMGGDVGMYSDGDDMGSEFWVTFNVYVPRSQKLDDIPTPQKVLKKYLTEPAVPSNGRRGVGGAVHEVKGNGLDSNIESVDLPLPGLEKSAVPLSPAAGGSLRFDDWEPKDESSKIFTLLYTEADDIVNVVARRLQQSCDDPIDLSLLREALFHPTKMKEAAESAHSKVSSSNNRSIKRESFSEYSTPGADHEPLTPGGPHSTPGGPHSTPGGPGTYTLPPLGNKPMLSNLSLSSVQRSIGRSSVASLPFSHHSSVSQMKKGGRNKTEATDFLSRHRKQGHNPASPTSPAGGSYAESLNRIGKEADRAFRELETEIKHQEDMSVEESFFSSSSDEEKESELVHTPRNPAIHHIAERVKRMSRQISGDSRGLTVSSATSVVNTSASEEEDDVLRIVLVDDDTTTLNMMKTMIENLGHNVRTFSSGEELVQFYSRFINATSLKERMRYYADVVFVDYFLPGINGAEATRKIRTLEKKENQKIKKMRKKGRSVTYLEPIPVIAITAMSSKQGTKSLQVAGANSRLVKPVSMMDLRNAINRFTNVHMERRKSKDYGIQALV